MRTTRRTDLKSEGVEVTSNLERLSLITIVHREEDSSHRWEWVKCGDLRLSEGHAEIFIDPHHLTCRLHLRAKNDVDTREA